MAFFSFLSGPSRGRLALGLMSIAAMPVCAAAQASRGASARLSVSPVVEIRGVSERSQRTAAAERVELVHEITTASNVDYQMTVIALSELGTLERGGVRVSVRTLTGGFAPMRAGLPVAVARGRRGSNSVTEVVLRVDGVPRRSHAKIREQLRTLVAFQATVETSSGSRVSSEAKLTAIE